MRIRNVLYTIGRSIKLKSPLKRHPISNLIDAASTQPVFLVVKRSLSLVLPLVMVGSLTLMFVHFPFPAAQQAIDTLLGSTGRRVCDSLISGSFGIASLALVCAMSGTSAMYANQVRRGPFISPIMAAVVVLACFFVMTSPADAMSYNTVFSMDRGLLLAMCIALAGSTLFFKLSRHTLFQLPFDIVGHDPVVRDVFTVMPAAVATIFFFGMVRSLFVCFDIADLHETARNLLAAPFPHDDNDLWFGVLYSGLSQILWFFGAHGPNLLFAIEEHILTPAALTNTNAVTLGIKPTLIFTKSFFDAFTRMGGSGCTLCLILAVVLRSKDRGIRKLCLFSLLPALCNVNEPLLFGVPLVFNPIYIIPFLLTPIVLTVTAYAATILDFVPHTVATATWTTPALVSGYVTTGSINGTLLQGVNLLLGLLVYLPFVSISDSIRVKQGKRVMQALVKVATQSDTVQNKRKCLEHPGEAGRLAQALSSDLGKALASANQLHLVYQPQLDAPSRRVLGVEALLRWNHPHYGPVAPPIAIALAEDTGLIDRLGLFILLEACEQRAAWKGLVAPDLSISVNVSPKQLQNPEFGKNVLAILRTTGIASGLLEIEITESSILEPNTQVLKTLADLQAHGIRLAIDDFGMGYASLRYLRAFPVNTVKIDRSLTEGCEGDINEQIARSVLDLSRCLNINTVVEGVEELSQVNRFIAMGYKTFQGYYFSEPLSGEDCLAFIRGLAANREDHAAWVQPVPQADPAGRA